MAAISPLFNLPLELRNLIYARLSRESATGAFASVAPYVRPSLLRVSKQFKAEYEREIFRRATLGLQATVNDVFRLPTPFSIPGYLLANIRRVELTVIMLMDWSKSKGEKPCSFMLDVANPAAEVLDERYGLLRWCCLPGIRTLKVRFVIELDTIESWLQNPINEDGMNNTNELFSRVQAISDICANTYDNAKVDIGVYVHTKLFKPFVDDSWDDLKESIAREMHQTLEDLGDNFVVYRARQCKSSDRYAFYGMELEVDECGHFDADKYDDLVKEAFEMNEQEDDSEDSIDSYDGAELYWLS